jgi:hypothetical protein
MPTCPRCATTIVDFWSHCPSCGVALTEVATPAVSAPGDPSLPGVPPPYTASTSVLPTPTWESPEAPSPSAPPSYMSPWGAQKYSPEAMTSPYAPPQSGDRRAGPNQRSAMTVMSIVAVVVAIGAVVGFIAPRLGSSPSNARTPTAIDTQPALAGQPDLDGLPTASRRLTSTSAHKIALIWFSDRDQARYGMDDSELGLLETGAAYRDDHAFTKIFVCGCLPKVYEHTVQSVQVDVPSATATDFLARIQTKTIPTGAPVEYTVAFTRVGLLWKAAVIVFDGLHHQPIVPSHHRRATRNPRAVLTALARYLQKWRRLGGRPVSKPHWTGAVTSLAQSWQSATRTTYDPRTKLYWGDFTLPVESGAYSFNIAGGTLTCGTIDMNEVASSPGHELFQPADGDSWGATVAPGAYPTIEDTNPDQICVLTRPGRGPAVVSWNGVEFYEPGPATPGATT